MSVVAPRGRDAGRRGRRRAANRGGRPDRGVADGGHRRRRPLQRAARPGPRRARGNYAIVRNFGDSGGDDGLFGGLIGSGDGREGDEQIAIRAAAYDPATTSVRLQPEGTFKAMRRFRKLKVDVTPDHGVTDVAGNRLDGDRDGQPGGQHGGSSTGRAGASPTATPTTTASACGSTARGGSTRFARSTSGRTVAGGTQVFLTGDVRATTAALRHRHPRPRRRRPGRDRPDRQPRPRHVDAGGKLRVHRGRNPAVGRSRAARVRDGSVERARELRRARPGGVHSLTTRRGRADDSPYESSDHPPARGPRGARPDPSRLPRLRHPDRGALHLYKGDEVPTDLDEITTLVVLGGPMSVADAAGGQFRFWPKRWRSCSGWWPPTGRCWGSASARCWRTRRVRRFTQT